MNRIISADGDGRIVYQVPGRRSGRVAFARGQANATESTPAGPGAQRPGRDLTTPPRRTRGPAGQESGERTDEPASSPSLESE